VDVKRLMKTCTNDHGESKSESSFDHREQEKEESDTVHTTVINKSLSNGDIKDAHEEMISHPQHHFHESISLNVIHNFATSVQNSLSKKRQNPTADGLYQTIYGDVGALLGSIDVFFPDSRPNDNPATPLLSNKTPKETSTSDTNQS